MLWPADKVERWPIDRLVPYARNARTHSDAQVAQVAASIQEWGWTNPVLVGEDGGIIAGHARVLAGRKLGLAEVPVMLATGWTEAQKRAYVLADNQLALNAGWDPELLRLELGDLQALDFDLGLIGFDDAQLAGLTQSNPGLTDPDEVPEPPAEPISKLGDVWVLGRHRLACGDATKAEDVAKALAGVQPHLMVTDPPYGVDYDADWRNKATGSIGARLGGSWATSTGRVLGDTQCNWVEAWQQFPGDVAYVWHAGNRALEMETSLREAKFEVRAQIVWVKQNFVISRGHYHPQHEPCFYAVRKGDGASHWQGDRTQSTVWEIHNRSAMGGRKDDADTNHSTQKPVECMKRPIENNSSPGQADL